MESSYGENTAPSTKPNTGSLFGRFKPKTTLKAIVTELAATSETESPPPQFKPTGGKKKPSPAAEEEFDLGDEADNIFASLLAGKNNLKVKKKTITTTTAAPKETSTKV